MPDLAEAQGQTLPVAVVIVAWNSAAVLEACLRAAAAQDPAEILVVDNGSTDATLQRYRPMFPHVRFIPLASNQGFASGCNIGVACSAAPFVLFLNDDAELRPGYLATLLAALATRPDAASATGKLLQHHHGQRLIDSAGISLDAYALRPQDRGQGERDVGQFDHPEDVFGPSGAAALYRRSALESLGADPFDASLFAYYEDVDLAWQLGRRGWRHLYVPSAVAYHSRRGPSTKPPRIAARAFTNRYRVWRKNESWQQFLRYAPVAIPWEIARLARLSWRNPALLKGILRQLLQ